MINHLYLDIETIPAQRPDVMAEITAEHQSALEVAVAAIQPPGNIKLQESKDKWFADEAPAKAKALRDGVAADIDAAYRKTGLDGSFGQICVIGFALDDEAPRTVYALEWAAKGIEHELLEDFYCELTDLIPRNQERSVCVVGHNVSGFDLRFMAQRSIVNRVQPHRVIASACQAKPWETEKVFDTMVQWGGVGARAGGSLDRICKALSIPTPKSGITGAQVWDNVKAGHITAVAEYCKRDVIATREVHRRLTFRSAPVVQMFDDVPA